MHTAGIITLTLTSCGFLLLAVNVWIFRHSLTQDKTMLLFYIAASGSLINAIAMTSDIVNTNALNYLAIYREQLISQIFDFWVGLIMMCQMQEFNQ